MLDDIIVAFDGLRMVDKDLTKRLANFKPKDELNVTFFCRDQLFTRLVTLGDIPKAKLKIVPVEQVSDEQKAFSSNGRV
jgi:predicted metalloprotease with PDZ domain